MLSRFLMCGSRLGSRSLSLGTEMLLGIAAMAQAQHGDHAGGAMHSGGHVGGVHHSGGVINNSDGNVYPNSGYGRPSHGGYSGLSYGDYGGYSGYNGSGYSGRSAHWRFKARNGVA